MSAKRQPRPVRVRFLKMLRSAFVMPYQFDYTPRLTIRCGGTSICHTDNATRADLIATAINSFRRTKAGKRWWRKQLVGVRPPEGGKEGK